VRELSLALFRTGTEQEIVTQRDEPFQVGAVAPPNGGGLAERASA
jgi:hypothetical protein